MARETTILDLDNAAEILTNPRALEHYYLTCDDPHGWSLFTAWCAGAPMTWRQTLRLQWVLRHLFEASYASSEEQNAAAHSYDDQGDGRGVRGGRGGDTFRLLQRARALLRS